MTDVALIGTSNTADDVSVKHGVVPVLCRKPSVARASSFVETTEDCYGGHPSYASSTTSLIFTGKKNLRIAGRPAIRSFSEGWWA